MKNEFFKVESVSDKAIVRAVRIKLLELQTLVQSLDVVCAHIQSLLLQMQQSNNSLRGHVYDVKVNTDGVLVFTIDYQVYIKCTPTCTKQFLPLQTLKTQSFKR